MRTLFLIRGASGSGKSTLAHQLFEHDLIFEADQYFYDEDENYNFDASKLNLAHGWCQLRVEHAMEDGLELYSHKIAVSNTFTTEKDLEPYIKLAKKYDYKVVSIIVENRHGNTSVHNVPEETVQKQKNKLLKNIKL